MASLFGSFLGLTDSLSHSHFQKAFFEYFQTPVGTVYFADTVLYA